MVTGIRLPFDLPEQAAIAEARRLTGLTANDIQAVVCRVSIDARRGQISRVYSVRIDAPFDEKAFAEKLQMPFVRYKPNTKIVIPHGEKRLEHRPVVVGLGPAGLFAAYVLAKHGYRPLVLERGGDLDERDKVVDAFWKGGALDTDCNIQFGEGGCATTCWKSLPRTVRRRISSKRRSRTSARISSRTLSAKCAARSSKTAVKCASARR